jgi:hypothetical protein
MLFIRCNDNNFYYSIEISVIIIIENRSWLKEMADKPKQLLPKQSKIIPIVITLILQKKEQEIFKHFLNVTLPHYIKVYFILFSF